MILGIMGLFSANKMRALSGFVMSLAEFILLILFLGLRYG
jgi:hypothetical protein